MEKIMSNDSFRTGLTYETFRDGDVLIHKVRKGPRCFAENRVKIPDSEKEVDELLKKIDELTDLIPAEIRKQKDLIRQGNAALKARQKGKAKRLLKEAKQVDANAEFLLEKANAYDFAMKLRLARLEVDVEYQEAQMRANRKVWGLKTKRPRISKIILKP